MRTAALVLVAIVAIVGAFAAGIYTGENADRPPVSLSPKASVTTATAAPIFPTPLTVLDTDCYAFAADQIWVYFDPYDPGKLCVNDGTYTRIEPNGAGGQIPEWCAVANDTVYCAAGDVSLTASNLRYLARRGQLPDASDVAEYCGFLRWRCWGDGG